MLKWIVSSCFLILAVLALRAALGQKISARLRYALWALVLVRLLIPVPLFTLHVAVDSAPIIDSTPEQRLETKLDDARPAQSIPMEDAGTAVTSASQPPVENSGQGTIQNRHVNTVSPIEFLKIIWAIGSIALALLLLASNLHFSLRLRRVRKPLQPVDCWLPVYIAEGLPSPCLFGILHPAVYVTDRAAENPAMLRHVLTHEMTHCRHLDHVWSVLRGIALVVHWWNPLVWLAVVCSRRDGELACDEGALKQLIREDRAAYGETLLTLVTAKPSPKDLLSCATTMSGEKRSLQERIRWISCRPKQIAGAVITVIVIAFLTSSCAFGRAERTPADNSKSLSGKLPADSAAPLENHAQTAANASIPDMQTILANISENDIQNLSASEHHSEIAQALRRISEKLTSESNITGWDNTVKTIFCIPLAIQQENNSQIDIYLEATYIENYICVTCEGKNDAPYQVTYYFEDAELYQAVCDWGTDAAEMSRYNQPILGRLEDIPLFYLW